MSVKSMVLGVLAYVVATFATQAVSHFGVNVEHYAQVQYLRPEPIYAFGFLSMIVQGVVMVVLYSRLLPPRPAMMTALRFAWLMGAFLTSYIAFAEAAKYTVPSVASWITVEVSAAAVQFTLFGVLLHFAFRKNPGL